MRVHVETNNPGPSGETSKSVRMGSQTRQANFQHMRVSHGKFVLTWERLCT